MTRNTLSRNSSAARSSVRVACSRLRPSNGSNSCPTGMRGNSNKSRDPSTASMAKSRAGAPAHFTRSEEHTSELQSRLHLVCRLLLEKNNNRLHHARHPRRPGSTLKVHYDDPATFDAITPVLHAPPRPIDAHYQPTPPQPPASALAYA